ncbi:MAG: hypothetical protein GY906_13465 [bacterium]|nr:hypothetical protein [bacterium]
MNINLGFVGFSWTPVHISLWTRWPKLPKVTYYYSMADIAEFTGLAYVYNLQVWDKRLDHDEGWRWQRQDKYVPLVGTWRDKPNYSAGDYHFQFLFWRFDIT